MLLPHDLEDIIIDYWIQLEYSELYQEVLKELRHIFLLVDIKGHSFP